jgi:hypothetical protein
MGEQIRAGGTVRWVDADTVTLDTWVAVERDGVTEWPIKKGQVVVRLSAVG